MSSSFSLSFGSSSEPSFLVKYGKHILVALGVCVVASAIMWANVTKKAELYTPAPTSFLSKDTTKYFLSGDVDEYGSKLNFVNLESCGVVSYQDLLDKWSTSATDFTSHEKKLLQDAALLADYQINKNIPNPMGSQLQTIGWLFAKTIHPYYLDGLPHTRLDVIFVTDKILSTFSNERLAALLVHEKIHLWQRKYPDEMQGWIDRQKYRKVKRVLEDGLQRMNPDVDEWLYENEQGDLLGVRFNSVKPLDLYDVSNYSKDNEHPHEQMAYQLQQSLFPGT